MVVQGDLKLSRTKGANCGGQKWVKLSTWTWGKWLGRWQNPGTLEHECQDVVHLGPLTVYRGDQRRKIGICCFNSGCFPVTYHLVPLIMQSQGVLGASMQVCFFEGRWYPLFGRYGKAKRKTRSFSRIPSETRPQLAKVSSHGASAVASPRFDVSATTRGRL